MVKFFLINFYVSSRYSSDLPEGEDKKNFVLENKPKDEYFCSEKAQLNIVAISLFLKYIVAFYMTIADTNKKMCSVLFPTKGLHIGSRVG